MRIEHVVACTPRSHPQREFDDEAHASYSATEWEPSCFFTGFNGPVDPGYACVASSNNSSEPLTLNHAMRRPDWDQWDRAIIEELAALETFNTFEVCVLPPGKKTVGCCYIFRVKITPTGDIKRYKVRLVAQGFLQQEGIDYNEVFAPFIDSTPITLLLAIANHFDWELEQMDVIRAFLHGRLEEEVYMKIPPRMYIEGGAEGKVL